MATIRTGGRVIKAERAIPVREDVDVLVAGGGLGGIAAALASARTELVAVQDELARQGVDLSR